MSELRACSRSQGRYGNLDMATTNHASGDHGSSCDHNASSDPSTVCQLCNNGKLVVFCKVCMHSMCQSCKAQHDELSDFEKHDVSPLCPSHCQPITFLCHQCVQGVCIRCMLNEHKQHGKSFDPFVDGIKTLKKNLVEQQVLVSKSMSEVLAQQEKTDFECKYAAETKELLMNFKAEHVDKVSKIDNLLNDIEENYEKRGFERQEKLSNLKQRGQEVTEELGKTCDDMNFLSQYTRHEETIHQLLQDCEKSVKSRLLYISSSCFSEVCAVLENENKKLPNYNWFNPKQIVCLKELKGYQLQEPRHLSLLEDNSVLVADGNAKNIYKIEVDGHVESQFEDMSEVRAVDCRYDYCYLLYIDKICTMPLNRSLREDQQDYVEITPKIDRMYKLCVYDDRHIFVIDRSNKTGYRYNLVLRDTQEVIRFDGSPSFISLIEDENTRFAVSIFSDKSHHVKIYNSEWKHELTIGSFGEGDGQLNNPSGTAITKSGDILIADRKNNRISLFSLDGQFRRHVRTKSDGIKSPYAIAYRKPFLWLTEYNFSTHAVVKCFKFG